MKKASYKIKFNRRNKTSQKGLVPLEIEVCINSKQKYNVYLKEIATLCDIEQNLTIHMARHIFATTVTLANGMPIETILKALGHTSLKTTQIYAKNSGF